MTQFSELGQRIAIIEDLPEYQGLLTLILRKTKHQIVARATDFDSALMVVDGMRTNDTPVDVVLLDGNLDGSRRDGYDAKRIITAIHAARLTPTIIGISMEHMAHLQGIEPEYDITKLGITAQILVPLLDRLPIISER